MELFAVETIILDEVTNELLRDVDTAARQVNEFRPLSAEVVKDVLRDLAGERVYNSNAIEGNTYGLRETRAILKTVHVDISRKREATEVLNLGKAIEYAEESLISAKEPFHPDGLLESHRILLAGINDDWAGRWRNQRVVISGATYQPPASRVIPELVQRCFSDVGSGPDVHPVLLATWTHWAIARIHPFFDGNGRTARLWQDVVLFRHKLTCAIIRPEDREDYLAALVAADEGNFNPLTQLVARRVTSTFDKYLSAQQADEDLDKFAREVLDETDARTSVKRKLSYIRWSRKMEHVRFEFERCAARITAADSGVEIQAHSRKLIDLAKWENIRSGLGASETGFFRLDVKRQRQSLRYFFFFGKHYWSDIDTEAEKSEPRVALFVGEKEPGPDLAPRLGEEGFDTPLSFRELFVVQGGLVRKRFDASQNADVYDRDLEPVSVAQEFIRDVLFQRFA